MISIATTYFSGLEKNDGKGNNGTGTYPFTDDCDRIENGSHTTNVPRPANEPKDAINGFALDCMSQFKLGYYFVVQAIHDRRASAEVGCRTRRGLGARSIRSGKPVAPARAFRWPAIYFWIFQFTFQHSGHRGVSD